MGDIEVQIPLDEGFQAAMVRGGHRNRGTPEEAVMHHQKVCILLSCEFKRGLAGIDGKGHLRDLAILTCDHQSIEGSVQWLEGPNFQICIKIGCQF